MYAERLLSAFPAEQRGEMSHPSQAEAVLRSTLEPSNALVEPLTERERDVLRLLETELSGPEIARELTIGLSTVRTYTKSIYRKLNVNSRRAAVKRASELDLL